MADNSDFYPRCDSPSQSHSPTAALSACPQLERSVSTPSSVTSSNVSRRSQSAERQAGKRRGYARPQATLFADSARNRDSVMSLGSIAHLQYYFARTGLLDGRGGQFAKDIKITGDENTETSTYAAAETHRPLYETVFHDDDSPTPPQLALSYSALGFDSSAVGSLDRSIISNSWEAANIPPLPPTVSTYKEKPIHVPPPPNLGVLRRELREALEDASKLLVELQAEERDMVEKRAEIQAWQTPPGSPLAQGWDQIQGMHVLDLVTIAIRAAKNYYTSHEQPRRLYAIRSERQIRSDLYSVLEVLKKFAARNFAGGIRPTETLKIAEWALGIEDMVSKDEEAERMEEERRQKWRWRDGVWHGIEREREWLFLKSFDHSLQLLPEWSAPMEPDKLPTPFLAALQNGLRLVRLHNELVKNSTRQFADIQVFHIDTAKPYRCAENLRFWVKAAEIRWDVQLEVDVIAVVRGEDAIAWQSFDKAVMKWCKSVREQIATEWKEYQEASRIERPMVRMDPSSQYRAGVPW